MGPSIATPLAQLYERDETAWLDAMSRLASERRLEELDCENLSDYLHSMAIRDRRAVRRRLVLLMLHLLKWKHQPEKRTTSWVRTIRTQRDELRQEVTSGTLKAYAESILAEAYASARADASAETGLLIDNFPATFSDCLDELLADDPEIRLG